MSDTNELPPGWTRASVAAIGADADQAVLTGPFGSKLKSGDFQSFGTPVLTIGCLTERGLDLRKANFISDALACEFDRYRLRPGDLLFSRMASVGRVCKVPPDHDRSLFNYHLMRLRLCEEAYLPDLFVQFIRGSRTVVAHLEEVNHGATRDGINTGQLLAMPVEVPPVPEQHRILAKLQALQARSDAAKEALDAIPPLLAKFRQSVLAAAFRGDLTKKWREAHPQVEPASELLARVRAERRRKWLGANPRKQYVEPEPVDTEGLPGLPDGWCWAAAEDIVEPGADIVYGIVQPGPEWPNGVPYVRGKDIQDGKILIDQLLRTSPEIAERYHRAALEGGDVLLGIIRATKVAIVPPELAGANLTQGTARFRPSSVISTSYLAAYLDCPFAQNWLHAQYRGIDMPGLNLRDVRRLPVALCPLNEQVTIQAKVAQHMGSLVSARSAAEAAAVNLATLNQAILAKAFRGELVPQDPNDEPASVLLERIRHERAAASDQGTVKRGRGRPKSATP